MNHQHRYQSLWHLVLFVIAMLTMNNTTGGQYGQYWDIFYVAVFVILVINGAYAIYHYVMSLGCSGGEVNDGG